MAREDCMDLRRLTLLNLGSPVRPAEEIPPTISLISAIRLTDLVLNVNGGVYPMVIPVRMYVLAK